MLIEIVVYTATMCSYCDKAKDLLRSKGVNFQEVSIMTSAKIRETMIKRSGGRKTVPQIFINGKHIGGYTDLKTLDDKGGLDKLLELNKRPKKSKPKVKKNNSLVSKLEEVKAPAPKVRPKISEG